jgi:hypothetical protein
MAGQWAQAVLSVQSKRWPALLAANFISVADFYALARCQRVEVAGLSKVMDVLVVIASGLSYLFFSRNLR